MAIGDFRVRVNRVGQNGAQCEAQCVAYIMRLDRHGEVEVLRAHGGGEAMALRELYKRVRLLLNMVKVAGELAVRVDSNE